MSVWTRIALAGLGSLALLLGALGFQFLGGYAPCPMCIWQRWPHLAAVLLAIGALLLPIGFRPAIVLAGAAAAAIASGLGVFHAGVERGWWEGPSSCVGMDPVGLSPEQLLDRLASAPLIRCDDIVWEFLGLSMAGWNAVFSAILAALWLSAARPHRRRRAD